MLREIKRVRQSPGEPRRRWWQDAYFDLNVWYDDAGAIIGFQLCYDRLEDERALTVLPGKKLTHHRVDSGEGRASRAKGIPILTERAGRIPDDLLRQFHKAAEQVDDTERTWICTWLDGATQASAGRSGAR